MHFSKLSILAAWAASVVPGSTAISLSDNPSRAELISAANAAKANMLTFYTGDKSGGIPGYALRPDVYYWWQVGGMLGQLIHHWHLTGDGSSNDLVKKAIEWQSTDNDYLQPNNQSNAEGNDDQVFWALACMDAAEYNFPAPDPASKISWLGLAQAVFNAQTARWHTDVCGGGLKWQIYQWNKGYYYKNMPSNGGLFQLAARLARYTGNETYSNWADRVWDWSVNMKLVAPRPETDLYPRDALHVFDGVPEDKCENGVNKVEFTYNFGMMIMGAAMMANHTGDQKWTTRCEQLMKGITIKQYLVGSVGPVGDNKQPEYQTGNILADTADEFQTPQTGNNDEPSFKAYTIRWMTIAGQLVPSIRDQVIAILKDSAVGAAKQCTGKAPGCPDCHTPAGYSTATPGEGDSWCGRRWYQTTWDGYSGFGEQMSAMSVFQNSLAFMAPQSADDHSAILPYTATTGGESESRPDAGAGANGGVRPDQKWYAPITTADRAGAWIMTLLSLSMVSLGLWFMITQ